MGGSHRLTAFSCIHSLSALLTQSIVADMSGVPCHAHSVDSELLVLTPEKLLLVCTLQTALEPTLQVGPCAAAVLMVPQIVQSMDAELLVLTIQ